MKVVILAGGFGTRLAELTTLSPKPMVEVGRRPILWHIMRIFAAYGHKEFIIALGYKGEVIKQYFLSYYYLRNSLRVHLESGRVSPHDEGREDWVVDLIDTGLRSETGGRLKRLTPWIANERFMMTYGDGVADMDIGELVKYHCLHGRLATVTAVRPPARFGGLIFDGDLVPEFTEKAQIGEGWINGGFLVFDPSVFEYLGGDDPSLEIHALERLAPDGQLGAYGHDRFWRCMDHLRDVRLLESLWQSGTPAWEVWE